MPINAETLRTLRAGKSMKRLSEEAGVDRRTIARIETGEIAPERVRDETVRRLARALGATPETLAQPPDHEAQRDAALRKSGYRTVRTILDGRTAVSFALVERRYGISPQRQIEMAPLFTTLLAEMSLADRRRQLDAANAAFNEAIAKLPGHLGCDGIVDARFNDAYCDEDSSIKAKDIFGRQILREGSGFFPPFRDYEGNPFFDFLDQQVEMLGERLGEEIAVFTDPAQDGLPRQPDVLDSYLMKTVCGDNHWGSRTLVDGHFRMRDIPAEQWRASPVERGAWLEAQYPQDVRAKKEAELARLDRELSELLEIDEKSDD